MDTRTSTFGTAANTLPARDARSAVLVIDRFDHWTSGADGLGAAVKLCVCWNPSESQTGSAA